MIANAANDRAAKLWTAYRRTGSVQDRNRLVEHYQPILHALARWYCVRSAGRAEWGDLVGHGAVGLMQAVEGYDDARGLFEPYAKYRIRGAILDGVRSDDAVPRQTRTQIRILDQAACDLANQLGRWPSDDELAEATGLDPRRVQRKLSPRIPVSLEAEDAEGNRIHTPAQPGYEPPYEALARQEHIASLGRLLSDRQRRMLEMRYRDDLSFRQIGERLGVCESRVSQMHTDLMALLLERASIPTESRIGA